MLAVERDKDNLQAFVNVYKDYSAVKPVIKQLVLSTGEILIIEAELLNSKGEVHRGALTTDNVQYTLRYNKGVNPSFDIKEAFEVHFQLAQDSIPGLKQNGFFRAISIYEKEARQQAREYFRKTYDEKVTFDPLSRDMVCRGKVILDTGNCLVLERNEDSASVHRHELLDKPPKVGQECLIRYKNFHGTVEIR